MKAAVAAVRLALRLGALLEELGAQSASFSAAAVSALTFWTIASGVPGGATRANQVTEMRSGKPTSAAVGHVGRHRAARPAHDGRGT